MATQRRRSEGARSNATAEQVERTLVITRVLDAPRELVFQVWTQPEHLCHWWGPKDFSTPSHAMDVREGGDYRICIRAPEGKEHTMRGTYREVVEPERLVFTFAWEDEHGAPVHETLVTVTFEDLDGKTRMTFHQALFRTMVERDDHNGGWSECFDRLGVYVARHDVA